MKRLIFIVLLFVIIDASAQQPLVSNRTSCPITATAVCYHTTTCVVTCSGPVVPVNPGTTEAPPLCECGPGSERGYVICWNQGPCTGCVAVSLPGLAPCPNFPNANQLPACGGCLGSGPGGNAIVSFLPNGNLEVK